MFEKKTIILYSVLLVLVMGIMLCGFTIGETASELFGKSIIKETDFDNTFEQNNINIIENPAPMPFYDDDASTPKSNPSDADVKKKLMLASKTAMKNLVSGEVVIEQTSRRVLWGKNEDAPLYPASTTKVLTALCVLNSLPLDKVVSVPKIAAGTEGSSIYLKAGQKITVEDLLFGLMLRSGNDAAVTLAIETSGSIAEFAALMNKTAVECGATNSNFVNPHGLHDENHYTTAHDLALICAKAYENEDFVRIVSSKIKKIKIDDTETVIGNKNKMLKLYSGANGVKTGFTKASGRCLVSGAKRGDMQLVSVVLNCGDMWNESVRLLNFGFDNYEMVPLEMLLS